MSELDTNFLKIFDAFFEDSTLPEHYFLRWNGSQIEISKKKGKAEENRHVLILLLTAINSPEIRTIWNEELAQTPRPDLPLVIGQDALMQMLAQGSPLTVEQFRRVFSRKRPSKNPHLIVGTTPQSGLFHGVKSLPPGLRSKFHPKSRKKRDPILFSQIQKDLEIVSAIEELEKRKIATLALLSHGASYRELEGRLLHIPSLVDKNPGVLIPYALEEHVLWEGVKTISLKPLEREDQEPGIYLAQGTEMWPSQPLMLGSIFANLGTMGSATEPYAHSWRQIHKHLSILSQKGASLPIVAGHSMGGALATQIAIYSHALISKAYAFNPPVVEKRDYDVYHRLSDEGKEKLLVFAGCDDFPFWRIGSKVIGKIHICFGSTRWKYYPFKELDRLLFFPALVKAFINLKHLAPAHQSIAMLSPSYCIVHLSDEEIALENAEREERRDKIRFFPRIYRLVEFLLDFTRKYFPWEKKKAYLLSQLELIELHQEDLKESLWISGNEDVRKELEELEFQKKGVLEELHKISFEIK